MPTHLALLRGINVGGRNKVRMAELRAVLEDLGHREVATYIQSGNVVFAPRRPAAPAAHAEDLRSAITTRLAVPPVVVVLTAADVDSIIDANPYVDEPDPKHVHALVQQVPLTAEQAAAAAAVLREHHGAGGPDHLTVIGATCYLHTPQGLGRSTLADWLARTRAAGQDRMTARNWATMLRLAQMLRG